MVSEISILIPVYNQMVLPLVEVLQNQAASLSIPYEIRVYDDGSSVDGLAKNEMLFRQPNVVYHPLRTNIGRSKIRFLLAKEAQYKWLLFLDNDVLPAQDNFLRTYLSEAIAEVVVGGIAYQKTYPEEAKLRWLYGKEREQAQAKVRQKSPYERVFFSNLLIHKATFLKAMQGVEVTGYGHEDTLFAQRLKDWGVEVLHIDNPAYHLGLEAAPVFLAKTEQAIKNLIHLQETQELGRNGKLFAAYQRITKWISPALLTKTSIRLMPLLHRNLISDKPRLFLFDLYKLFLFIQQKTK